MLTFMCQAICWNWGDVVGRFFVTNFFRFFRHLYDTFLAQGVKYSGFIFGLGALQGGNFHVGGPCLDWGHDVYTFGVCAFLGFSDTPAPHLPTSVQVPCWCTSVLLVSTCAPIKDTVMLVRGQRASQHRGGYFLQVRLAIWFL